MRPQRKDKPLYMISVAAELSGLHPQTLRIYERRELIAPKRSAGNTRLYSEEDIARLRQITHLTQAEGINLAGVERILALQDELRAVSRRLERLKRAQEETEERIEREKERVRRSYRAEIVHVRRGHLARREER